MMKLGITAGGAYLFESAQSYLTLSECEAPSANGLSCSFFDYNCQTGDCVFITMAVQRVMVQIKFCFKIDISGLQS